MKWNVVLVASTIAGCISGSTTHTIEETQRAADAELRPVAARTEHRRGRAQAPADDTLARGVSLRAVLALAVERDPELRAHALRARALVHAARAATAMPPPELDAEVWNLPLERPYALDQATMYMVALRQRFPAAGALDANARATIEEARVELAAATVREREVRERVAEAYADYLGATLDHRVHERHLALLHDLDEVTRARLAAGASTVADVARVAAYAASVRERLARVDGTREAARGTLDALLQRPLDAPLGEPTDADTQTVDGELAALVDQAARARGELAQDDARVAASRARVDAAHAEADVPEFSASLGYWQDPQARPGFGATFSMTLPWLFEGGRERVLAAQDDAEAADAERRAALVDVRADVAHTLAEVRARAAELRVLRGEARPASEAALSAVRATYATGGSSLLDWLDAARAVLDVDTDDAALVAELARAIAQLESAIGHDLPRAPLDAASAPAGTEVSP